MSFVRGKDAWAGITDAVGSARDLQAYVTSKESTLEVDILDTTTWGNSYKSSIKGFLGWSGSITGNYDDGTGETPDKWFFNLINSAAATASVLTFAPAGSATGKLFEKGTVHFANYKKSIPVDGLVTFTADYQLASGSVVRGTF